MSSSGAGEGAEVNTPAAVNCTVCRTFKATFCGVIEKLIKECAEHAMIRVREIDDAYR
jgi:hypothetical protein